MADIDETVSKVTETIKVQGTKFFEEAPGVKSHTRLMITVLIGYGILSSLAVLVVGLAMYHQSKEALPIVVAASTGNISTISALAIAWKQMQKVVETKGDQNQNQNP